MNEQDMLTEAWQTLYPKIEVAARHVLFNMPPKHTVTTAGLASEICTRHGISDRKAIVRLYHALASIALHGMRDSATRLAPRPSNFRQGQVVRPFAWHAPRPLHEDKLLNVSEGQLLALRSAVTANSLKRALQILDGILKSSHGTAQSAPISGGQSGVADGVKTNERTTCEEDSARRPQDDGYYSDPEIWP